MKKQYLPQKTCNVCERPFTWRKKWEKNWEEVKYCSERCRKNKWLTSKDLNRKRSSSIKWNFQKYLVDDKGNLIDYYYSITKPMSSKITKHL